LSCGARPSPRVLALGVPHRRERSVGREIGNRDRAEGATVPVLDRLAATHPDVIRHTLKATEDLGAGVDLGEGRAIEAQDAGRERGDVDVRRRRAPDRTGCTAAVVAGGDAVVPALDRARAVRDPYVA